MNDTGRLDHNKKVKQETDLQSDNKSTFQSDTLFAINTAPLKVLPQWPYLDWPTYNGPTHDGPIYKGRAKCLAHGAY